MSHRQTPKPKHRTALAFGQLPQDGYVRERQLLDGILPFSATTLWRMVRENRFPRPVKLSGRITAWPVEAVRAWMNQH